MAKKQLMLILYKTWLNIQYVGHCHSYESQNVYMEEHLSVHTAGSTTESCFKYHQGCLTDLSDLEINFLSFTPVHKMYRLQPSPTLLLLILLPLSLLLWS